MKVMRRVLVVAFLAALSVSLMGCASVGRYTNGSIMDAEDAYSAVSRLNTSLETGMSLVEYETAVSAANYQLEMLQGTENADRMQDFIYEIEGAVNEYNAALEEWSNLEWDGYYDEDLVQECWANADAHVQYAGELIPTNERPTRY